MTQVLPQFLLPSHLCRILDIPCKVCGDYSSGKHYNIFACDGCAGFFKRSIRRNRRYLCKGKDEGSCIIDKAHRNQCRACRLKKCQEVGMNKEAVQHERGPRNSTIRRAMHSYLEDQQQRVIADMSSATSRNLQLMEHHLSSGVLNLSQNIARFPPPAVESTSISMNFPLVHGLTYGFLMPGVLPMQMSPPRSPLSCFIFPTELCEHAARVLLSMVQWTKSQEAFTALPLSDQYILLEKSWTELFLLGMVAMLPPIDLRPLLEMSNPMKTPNAHEFVETVKQFQTILLEAKHMQLDSTEIGCIKTMALFKKTSQRLISLESISKTAEEAREQLKSHLNLVRPHDSLRFSKILLMLKSMGGVGSDVIKELFFKDAVNNTPMERVILDAYKKPQLTF
ncbi:nuclear receptor subfamily 2 group E member 1 isoform X2 [Euwallacea fornicatus]|uniref:nuclear receptor subfamily 2 group E member 1 isoform X2 n=1 Tax=Euwallacea fornicatus TaxID=995702 RepID=UPI0033900FF3